eukprot:TRINITY_DN10553_c0_g2_i1.p1 TRINITY_DN10553_c0_g2~~TRINITY_DN10553_c0_g2_i1.p1  ORF type:complete len:431 (-),score=68.16 TRINITY_DN10553_c0_g2_i1:164-1456(-)
MPIVSYLFFMMLCVFVHSNDPFSVLHPSDQHFFNNFRSSVGSFDHSKLLRLYFERFRSLPTLTPVVIIPSLVGNALNAKLVNSNPPHWYCSSNWDWFRIYLDVKELLFLDCWIHNMKLYYNSSTHSYFSDTGIFFQIPGFGNLTGVDYLDEDQQNPIWAKLASFLSELGYKVGFNLRAAPYDWRLGPDDPVFQLYLRALKKLVEETYVENNNTKVAITSLSMGGTVFLYFLTTVDQNWKDKYIHSFTPLSSCFGGSTSATAALMGTTMEGYKIQPLAVGYGSAYWLNPFPTLGPSDRIIVTTPTRNYSVTQLYDLFGDVGLSTVSRDIYESVAKFQTLSPPRVPTNCIFGTGLPTLDSLHFNTSQWFDGGVQNQMAAGDSVCTHLSLNLCRIWASEQTQPASTFEIPNMVHGEAIQNPLVFRIFLELLLK